MSSKNQLLSGNLTSPLSMEKQLKLDEREKRLRRLSDTFQPLVCRPENSRVTRSSLAALDIKRDKLDKIVKDICEQNLTKAESGKTLRRRTISCSKDVASGDQVSTKFVSLEVLNKKLESEFKARSRRKTDFNSTPPKNISEAKPAKKLKTRKESRSVSAIEKHVLSKENVCKNHNLPVNKSTEKEISSVKSEVHIPSEKKVKKDAKVRKRSLISTKAEVEVEVPKAAEDKVPINPEILKIYTDKTVKKFNNLETIFESPVGSIVMGKRKVRRYVNFEEANSSVKQARRKAKVRKVNPTFRMSCIKLENLKLKDLDSLFL